MRRLDLSTYASAEDFFEAARDAARERAGILRAIGSMERREGVRAQGYEALGRSGGVRDRMAATDERMDYEADRGPVLEEDEAMLRLAESLIWGGDGGDMDGGLLNLVGYPVAKAMELRYVHGLPLSAIARSMGYSPKSKQVVADLCRIGLECVDSHGLMSVVRGMGAAT